MIIRLGFSPNSEIVPLNYSSKLKSFIYKLIGKNSEYHDKVSTWSYTKLTNGNTLTINGKKFLNFPEGANWIIKSPDEKFISTILQNIQSFQNVELLCGMKLITLNVQPTVLQKDGRVRFYLNTPIILKESGVDKKTIFNTYNSQVEHTSSMMKNILLKKAKEAKITLNNDFSIEFDSNYTNKYITKTKVNKIINIGSMCPIIVNGDASVLSAVYAFGVGHSTGIGFGTISKYEYL